MTEDVEREEETAVNRTPFGVYLIASLQLLLGLYAFGVGTIGMGLNIMGLIVGVEDTLLLNVVSVLALVLGVAMVILAWGFFSLKSWAYTITLVVQVLSILREIVVFTGGEGRFVLTSVVVSLVILYYLRRDEMKQAFGK
ncbi:MAG TPA: hypothetical protein EYH05_17605 [Anaerolineae bacterium]|nr:hypothetical protein [Anaerolineae bacterium]